MNEDTKYHAKSLRTKANRSITKNTKKHSADYTIIAPPSKRQLAKKAKAESEEKNALSALQTSDASFSYHEYLNMRTMTKVLINDAWVDRFAAEMTKWVDTNVDAIRVSEFLQIKSMGWDDFESLMLKSLPLRKAYAYTLTILAQNREKQGANFKMNWATLASTQAHYCRIAKGEAENRAKLKEQAQQDSGTKFIVMESVDELAKLIKKERE